MSASHSILRQVNGELVFSNREFLMGFTVNEL